MKKLVAVITILMVLAGCIHLNPKFRSENEFEGLDKKFEDNAETAHAGDSVLFCFIIHGIGHQEQHYAYPMIDQLGKNLLGKKYNHDSIVNLMDDKTLEKHVLTSSDRSKKIVFYSLTWSPYSDPYKEALRAQEFDSFPAKHNAIKDGIMIDRAGDLFFAQHTEVLPKILTLIDTSLYDMVNVESGSKSNHLNLISGSLGSQVLLKYLKLNYANFNGLNECLGKEDSTFAALIFNGSSTENLFPGDMEKSNFVDQFFMDFDDTSKSETGKQLNFYMLTNQVNLMPNNLEYWGGIDLNCGVDPARLCFVKTDFVAFRNPGDMLCYYLPKKILIGDSHCNPNNTDVTNIYYWNFLFRNNIISAHTIPFRLKKMHKVLAYGSMKQPGVFNWVKVVD